MYPKPEIIEVNKNSVGNLVFKISIILNFPEIKDTITNEESKEVEKIIISNTKTIAFQIKSSEQSAKEHLLQCMNGILYEGKHYDCPGVFYTNEKSVGVLISLAKFVGAIISPEIEEAIQIIRALRGTAKKSLLGDWLEYRRFFRLFSAKQWEALEDLGVIRRAGGRIIFCECRKEKTRKSIQEKSD